MGLILLYRHSIMIIYNVMRMIHIVLILKTNQSRHVYSMVDDSTHTYNALKSLPFSQHSLNFFKQQAKILSLSSMEL